MKNKTLGNLVIISISLAILAQLMSGYSTMADFSDLLFSIAGLGLLVFGIWGAIRLTKLDN